jgi:hypothetical protein
MIRSQTMEPTSKYKGWPTLQNNMQAIPENNPTNKTKAGPGFVQNMAFFNPRIDIVQELPRRPLMVGESKLGGNSAEFHSAKIGGREGTGNMDHLYKMNPKAN